jgi:riboflavin kinase/FMN adenylyltransferase
MQLHLGYSDVPEAGRGAAVALGNFDGVHRGHRAVLDAARAVAEAKGAPLGVLTFEPHPRSFFQPATPPFRLTSPRTKADLLAAAGVDWLYQATFDRSFAAHDPEAFAAEVLCDGLGARAVICGYDFVFGKGRLGNTKVLEALGKRLGFAVTVVPPARNGDAAYSSTVIRGLLQDGKPREAAEMLGHRWTIEGEVKTGDARGRTIGFPTANIELGAFLVPALGVYAVRAGLEMPDGNRAWAPAVANLGRRPTFDKRDILLEVHLIDFQGDLYGRRLWVEFVDYIRPEQKFSGLDALKAQITADRDKAKEILVRT